MWMPLQGEIGDRFYVIQQGEVAITDGSDNELGRKGPKDYFGELSLLKNEPRTATVRTVTPTSVLSLNRYRLKLHVAEDSMRVLSG